MEDLKVTLETYRMQLSQIEAAISSGQTDQELYSLQDEMKELISLTEESLLSFEKSNLLSMVEDTTPDEKEGIACSSAVSHSCKQPDASTSSMDDMMASFYADIASSESDEKQTNNISNSMPNVCETAAGYQIPSISASNIINKKHICPEAIDEQSENDSKLNDEFLKTIEACDDITGTKCQAPYQTDWTGSQYHNAMIMSVISDSESDEAAKESIFVKVLFLNPTLEQMKPCPYFLEGNCKFDVSNCKFSHGYIASLYNLRKFKEPDFSNFLVDSSCIAKHSSGIWHPATLIEILDDHQYTIQFAHQNLTTTVSIDDVLPLSQTDDSSDSEDATTTDDDDDDDIVVVLNESSSRDKSSTHSSMLGGWEQYTTGFGSRMLQKYGYKMGDGLGKDKSGRVEPVPVVVLPAGKSLDHCMRLKQKRDGVVDATSGTGLPRKRHRHTVFHFLNKTLGDQKCKDNYLRKLLPKDSFGIKKEKSRSGPCKIQVELVKNDSKIKQLKDKIKKYKESISRNSERAPNVAKQQRAKLEEALSQLRGIQSTSKAIELHQHRAETHRKMTKF